VVTAALDGMVKVLDAADLSIVSEYHLRKCCPLVTCHGARSVCVSRDGRKLLIGTSGGDILELFAADGRCGEPRRGLICGLTLCVRDVNNGPLCASHAKGKLYGLAAHNLHPEYATVGDDRKLRVWGLQPPALKGTLSLPDLARYRNAASFLIA
jgi:hypothetical protein